MRDTDSAELLSQIEQKRTILVLWPAMLFASLIVPALLVTIGAPLLLVNLAIVLLLVGTVVVYQLDQLRKTVVFLYDLDGPALDAYSNLCRAVEEVMSCGAVWHVTARGAVNNRKYHAGAGHLIDRKTCSFDFQDPPYVKTNLNVPCLPFGPHTFYLLPDRMLVKAPNGFGSVRYGELKISCSVTQFVEEGRVPHDSEVVDSTWRYVNKDGGPDRRFNRNPQIPICRYEEVQFTTFSGICEVLQLSRIGVATAFEAAIDEMDRCLDDVPRTDRPLLEPPENIQLTESPLTATQLRSAPPPTPEKMNRALFEILCCVMVADGRVSTSEKSAICRVMATIPQGWTDDDCLARIGSFLNTVRTDGYHTVLQRSLSRLPMLKQSGRQSLIVKSIDLIANADRNLSKHEHQLCNRIRKLLELPPLRIQANSQKPDRGSEDVDSQ